MLTPPAVFDLEVEEAAATSLHAEDQGGCQLLQLQRLTGTSQQGLFVIKLIKDVRTYKRTLLAEEGSCDTVTLASELANVGYRVSIRTALGGGSGTTCFQNLQNSFLVVQDSHAEEYIVELQFREHFNIPHPTPLYAQLLAATPEEFVGTAHTLVPLVQLLSQEMIAAFKAQGRTCPPWRQIKSVLSKWLPARRTDVDFSQPSSPISSLEFLPNNTGMAFNMVDVVAAAASARAKACSYFRQEDEHASHGGFALDSKLRKLPLQQVSSNKSLLTKTLGGAGKPQPAYASSGPLQGLRRVPA